MKRPRHETWATYDIEAVNWNEFVIACIYVDGRSIFARTPEELVDGLVENSCSYRVYWAHFGGRYDVRFILPILLERFECKFNVVSSGLVKVAVYKGRRKLFELRDSFNILQSSLKKLCDSFDVETKKLDVDRNRIQDLSQEELEEYVEIDCIALLQVLHSARQKFGVEDFKMTIASQAKSEWKKFDNESRYYVNAERYYKFIRDSYYGGRTEVFRRYGKDLYYYDINSMYPDVMRNNDYPCGRYKHVRDWVNGKLGIYKTKVKSPTFLEIPFLPMRNEEGKLMFPLGEWTAHYTSVEIEKARALGYQIDIIEGVVWEEKSRPFTGYVDKWHKIKTEASNKGDEAQKLIAKLHLNSLYGKFGQRREFKKVVQGLKREHLAKDCRPLFDNMELYEITEEDKKKFCTTQIASFVTSYARISLYEGIEMAHTKNGRVFYCDTDSIVTDVRIPEGHDLGTWEREAEMDEGVFLLPKVYAYTKDGSVSFRAKGFGRESLTWEGYKKALNGDFSGFVSCRERIAGLWDASRRGISIIDTVELRRSLTGLFDKRELVSNGMSTVPHRVGL